MGTTLKKNKDGYGYKYTELAEIHKYLEENNMRYIQQIKRIDNDDYVMTKRCFDGKWEDEWLQGCKVVDATLQGIKNPAQEQGSALTYARRYSLLMAFGLATEDDDAQSLSRTTEEKKISEKQIAVLQSVYKNEMMDKLLQANNIEKIEDLSSKKASELIKKINEKRGER